MVTEECFGSSKDGGLARKGKAPIRKVLGTSILIYPALLNYEFPGKIFFFFNRKRNISLKFSIKV